MLIVGLGNPGKSYENTRHNCGYLVIDKIAKKLKINFKTEKKLNADIAITQKMGQKIILAKPLSFMNLSGQVVKKILSYYDACPEDLWVISDDLDLPISRLRIRNSGESGGHNGLQSIIDVLGSEKFTRIRIGIGEDIAQSHADINSGIYKIDAKEFVLEKFTKQEIPVLNLSLDKAEDIIIQSIKSKQIQAHTY
ncbi:MAG TPA: aminoacyl-tRNA hydrolase [Patescibacteria group bacterium]|nr:aminoacyl-tRNA hydrolase [Patescibacteria group bacterium]